ncbi:hypothetical protein [Thioalkalivibrio paradoxus]|uniref:Uncharacterized protein n=1 Tax=Thioalkalivibrio paradoxus ARh 1 TaxID=713585 RepID=W0DKV8_9GAMM|nr:hypothetical protein [Thioalkalivibrio paradoxus]AHE97525.1 hypothetical protein THITH_03755 [Thioalkalivibrio paradoxus ARh 1]
MKPHAWILLLLLSLAAVPGCAMNETRELPEPRAGVVTDMAEFEAFLALAPTPDEFREVYPDVVLILPGDIATREYRTDNSRYFADLDEEERITGGSFQ